MKQNLPALQLQRVSSELLPMLREEDGLGSDKSCKYNQNNQIQTDVYIEKQEAKSESITE